MLAWYIVGILTFIGGFIITLFALLKTLKISKILQDIFFYKSFDLTQNEEVLQPLYISYSQVCSRYIPIIGIFKYKRVQFEIPPSCHLLLFAFYLKLIFCTNLIFASFYSELVIYAAVFIGIIISEIFIVLTEVINRVFLSSFNVPISKASDYALGNSGYSYQKQVNNTMGNEGSDKETFKHNRYLEGSLLSSIMIIMFLTLWGTRFISIESEDEIKASVIQSLIGIGIDFPLRFLTCYILKAFRMVPIYEKKYAVFNVKIQPEDLKKYQKTPLRACYEDITLNGVEVSLFAEEKKDIAFIPNKDIDENSKTLFTNEEENSFVKTILPPIKRHPKRIEFLKGYDAFLENMNKVYCEESEENIESFDEMSLRKHKRTDSDEDTIASHNELSDNEFILCPEEFFSTPRPAKIIEFASPSPQRNRSPDRKNYSPDKSTLVLTLFKCEAENTLAFDIAESENYPKNEYNPDMTFSNGICNENTDESIPKNLKIQSEDYIVVKAHEKLVITKDPNDLSRVSSLVMLTTPPKMPKRHKRSLKTKQKNQAEDYSILYPQISKSPQDWGKRNPKNLINTPEKQKSLSCDPNFRAPTPEEMISIACKNKKIYVDDKIFQRKSEQDILMHVDEILHENEKSPAVEKLKMMLESRKSFQNKTRDASLHELGCYEEDYSSPYAKAGYKSPLPKYQKPPKNAKNQVLSPSKSDNRLKSVVYEF
ncbi:unnamed protein product [Blepharisma stoltei]|uniref:Uncharacterized protein n=1 Tax=Blepharisma stoltei TaxID=1481888 RepID=A0AAU9IPZ0_9CILI|nr:unnamed protein product [Blepharisma stoltei]